MIAIVLIVVLVVVFIVIQRVIGKSVNAADRAVRRKTYNEGRSQVATGLNLSSPVSPSKTIDNIVEVVNAYDKAPPAVPGLYLKSRSDTHAQFGFGSKLQGDHFDAAVRMTQTQTGEGSVGTFKILHWRENGAEISGRKEMSRLRGRISQSIQGVGGQSKET